MESLLRMFCSRLEPSSDRFKSFPTFSSQTAKCKYEGFTLPWDCSQHDEQLSIHLKTRKRDAGLMFVFMVSKLGFTPGSRRSSTGQDSGSRRGRTGRMRFPNEESWVMKKPEECVCACCKRSDTKANVYMKRVPADSYQLIMIKQRRYKSIFRSAARRILFRQS